MSTGTMASSMLLTGIVLPYWHIGMSEEGDHLKPQLYPEHPEHAHIGSIL